MADLFKQLQQQLRSQGWRLEPTKKGFMAYSPDGVTKVLMHISPSDHRAYHNVLSQLKKGGFSP